MIVLKMVKVIVLNNWKKIEIVFNYHGWSICALFGVD